MAVVTINPFFSSQTHPPINSLDERCLEIQKAIPIDANDSFNVESPVDMQIVPGRVFDFVSESFGPALVGFKQDSKGIYIPIEQEPEIDEIDIHRMLDSSPDLIKQILAGNFPRFYPNDELIRLYNLNMIAGSQIMLGVRPEYVSVALKRLGALMQREGGTNGYHSISISKLHPNSVPGMALSAPIIIRPGCRPVDNINVQRSLVTLFSDLIDLAADEPDQYFYKGEFGGCVPVEETNGLLYRSQGTLEFKQVWKRLIHEESLPQFEDDLTEMKYGSGLDIIAQLMRDPNTLTEAQLLELEGISSRAFQYLSICFQDARIGTAGHRGFVHNIY